MIFPLQDICKSEKQNHCFLPPPPYSVGKGAVNLLFWQVRNFLSYSSKFLQTPEIKAEMLTNVTHTSEEDGT